MPVRLTQRHPRRLSGISDVRKLQKWCKQIASLEPTGGHDGQR